MHAFKSASELRHLLRSKKVTARDLLEEYLSRIDRYDVALHAIAWQDRAKARQVADAFEPGDPRPLAGIPMTVKEAFDLAGAPTTFGVPELKNNIAKHDSVVVARLPEAGANVFGKSNVPLGLSDLSWVALAWLPWSGLASMASEVVPCVPPSAGDSWLFNVFRIKRPNGPAERERDAIYAAWSTPDGPSFHEPGAFRRLEFC